MSKPVLVLIVEDEALLALNMRMVLEDKGFEVVGIAASGEDAVDRALQSNPSLILMDIKLSGKMDGIEAARRIVSTHSQTQPRIVYVTGNADPRTRDAALGTRPAGFIEKPFEDEELCLALEHALKSNNLTIWQ